MIVDSHCHLDTANLYNELLSDVECTVPMVTDDRHVYHIYSVLVDQRDHVQKSLGNSGINTNIHYPIPVHLQGAYSDLGYKKGDFLITESLSTKFLSLPMYAELSEEQQQVVEFINVVRDEDIPLCETVQKGLHSRGYSQGRFIANEARSYFSEHAVHDFQRRVLKSLS